MDWPRGTCCRERWEDSVLEKKKAVSLRTVADRVGLAPCSVSAVLNNTPASWAIPQRTKDRVFRAAAQLNYRPNFYARSLRTKRTHMVAVVSSDLGRGPVARVVAGVERGLRRRGYLLILSTLEHASEWAATCAELRQRGTEGMIAIGTSLPEDAALPVVFVDPGYSSIREPLAESERASLAQLGESAVQSIVAKIESGAGQSSVASFPPAMHDLPKIAASQSIGAMGMAGD